MESNGLSTLSLMRSHRDLAYLNFVRNLQCCVSMFNIEVVAHHVRMKGGGGTGLKPSDYLAVPLTGALHRTLHQHGEAEFWKHYDTDPLAVIESQLVSFLYAYSMDNKEDSARFEELRKSLTADRADSVRRLIEAVATLRGTR